MKWEKWNYGSENFEVKTSDLQRSSAASPTAAAAAAAAAAENHGLIVYAVMYTFYQIGKLLFNFYWRQ